VDVPETPEKLLNHGSRVRLMIQVQAVLHMRAAIITKFFMNLFILKDGAFAPSFFDT
jgi:hypothetical protein